MNILANHLPACKLSRDSVSGHCYNFDSSSSCIIPSLAARQQSSNDGMKLYTEDIVMLDGDYSATRSDCQRENEDHRSQSEFQFCSFSKSVQKYSNLTFPRHIMASGYSDSVCAFI